MNAAAGYSRRLEQLVAALGGPGTEGLAARAPLGRYTSFRIGGPADLLYKPPSAQALAGALGAAARFSIPVTLLGGGTNVLVSDQGVRGLVLRLGKVFDYLDWGKEERGHVAVEAGASTPLVRLVRESVARGLAGIEFAAGIPGSVGGGTWMNAGAFGGEIGEAIVGAEAASIAGELLTLDRSSLRFSYRKLALDVEVMITSVRFSLRRSSERGLRKVVEAVQAKRGRNQPLGFPNAGSVFKNPPGEYAGRLIAATGLKGRTVGRARISPQHGNFIVNLGGAQAREVRDLMGIVQDEVWKRSGVWLEPEVRLIGEWDEDGT